MDIFKLETFCKVYELRSFSRAAKELFISQPTVSSHILSLEKELEHNLFDRLGKNIIPTPAGELLYRYAKEIIELIDQVTYEVNLLKDQIVGDLKVGGSTIPGSYILPGVISKFIKLYPDVKVTLDISDSTDILAKVLEGVLDLAIVGAVQNEVDLIFQDIIEDELVFVGKANLLQDVSEIDDVVKAPWIIREKGSGTRRAVEYGLIKAGITIDDLNVRACVANTQGLLSLVRQGVGITVTSVYAAKEILYDPEIVIKKFPFFKFQRNFSLVYHRERTLFPASLFFIKFVKDFFQESKEAVREIT